MSVKFKKRISYDSGIPLFGTYPEETLAHVPRKMSINMFLETLFVVAKKKIASNREMPK